MKKIENDVIKALGMVTQIGISMMVPIALSVFLAYHLERWRPTGVWMLVMLPVGVAAAFRSVYLLTKSFYSKDLEQENKDIQYIEGLKEQGRENRKKDAREKDAE